MTEFVRVCSVDDVPKGTAVRAVTGDLEIAVVHADDDAFYAVYDECSHAAVALSEGEIDGCTLECWLHGSRFDLRTGKAINLPAIDPVPVYPCEVTGDDVLVDVHNPYPTP